MSLFIRTFHFMELFSVRSERLEYAKLIILYKAKSINLIPKYESLLLRILVNYEFIFLN